MLSPTSPCELSEREVTSPSNLKVVGALDNYSLVFVSFLLNFDEIVIGWQASTLTYFSTCPFGRLTKKITCPTQSFSCPKKLRKNTKTRE
jgi:hypothetical protein